jgi:hypothetical protein
MNRVHSILATKLYFKMLQNAKINKKVGECYFVGNNNANRKKGSKSQFNLILVFLVHNLQHHETF